MAVSAPRGNVLANDTATMPTMISELAPPTEHSRGWETLMGEVRL
jgi:hypothetical protein